MVTSKAWVQIPADPVFSSEIRLMLNPVRMKTDSCDGNDVTLYLSFPTMKVWIVYPPTYFRISLVMRKRLIKNYAYLLTLQCYYLYLSTRITLYFRKSRRKHKHLRYWEAGKCVNITYYGRWLLHVRQLCRRRTMHDQSNFIKYTYLLTYLQSILIQLIKYTYLYLRTYNIFVQQKEMFFLP